MNTSERVFAIHRNRGGSREERGKRLLGAAASAIHGATWRYIDQGAKDGITDLLAAAFHFLGWNDLRQFTIEDIAERWDCLNLCGPNDHESEAFEDECHRIAEALEQLIDRN